MSLRCQIYKALFPFWLTVFISQIISIYKINIRFTVKQINSDFPSSIFLFFQISEVEFIFFNQSKNTPDFFSKSWFSSSVSWLWIVIISSFGYKAEEIFNEVRQVQIVACGTSYNAGLVAKYWLEDIAKIPCNVEVASEYRYRHPILLNGTLLVTLSQSGETADTVEALKTAKKINSSINSLCISNSSESSLTRLSDLNFLTHAGPEIGVASTKAFTTQLVALALLVCSIGKLKNTINTKQEKGIVNGLRRLPGLINDALLQESKIKK